MKCSMFVDLTPEIHIDGYVKAWAQVYAYGVGNGILEMGELGMWIKPS